MTLKVSPQYSVTLIKHLANEKILLVTIFHEQIFIRLIFPLSLSLSVPLGRGFDNERAQLVLSGDRKNSNPKQACKLCCFLQGNKNRHVLSGRLTW